MPSSPEPGNCPTGPGSSSRPRPAKPYRTPQSANSAERRPSKLTPHEIRSAFRNWAAEIGADWAVAELRLGHRAGTDVELAYQRSDLLERRRELMENWAHYLNP